MHDEFIDDVSNNVEMVKKYTLEELKELDFSFRKSTDLSDDFVFKILILEEILNFFDENFDKLGNKKIKIETKNIFLYSNQNIKNLANIFNKFLKLRNNVIHLSYKLNNLDILRKYQIKTKAIEIKTDILCDYKIILLISKIYKNIDCIPFRIKTDYSLIGIK